MQVQVGSLRSLRRPDIIGMPSIRPALECARLPGRLLSAAVQVITEEWGLDIFSKLACRFMSSERHNADTVSLGCLPLPMEPWPSNDKIRVLWIAFLGMTKNLPWAPRVFLIPESGHIQVRHRRGDRK